MTRALFLALLLTGCAGPLTSVTNGPVTYRTGDAADVRVFCRRLTHRDRGWCVQWTATTLLIACPNDLTRDACLVHELRHYVEPDWRHE